MDKTHQDHDKPYSVGLLLIDDFAMMSYASTVEPLRAANLLSGKNLYDIRHLAVDDRRATSSGGIELKASLNIKDASALDLLLVIAGGNPASFQNTQIFTALRQLSAKGVILGGVSGGPFILANAAVMSGRRMTIHWEHAPALVEKWPDLLLTRSLYVMDRNRVSCAGGTAPLDMMHALITSHHGAQFARQVSDWFMHTEVRPAGGQQRAGLVERYNTANAAVVETIEVMENHVADPLSLPQLAALCDLSPRQLNRLFRDQLEQGTMQFYRELRLKIALNLCQQSTLSIAEIAVATGFANLSRFSAAFRENFDMAPTEARRAFYKV
ncbi:MAG: GlxA family transcriptional regulator [Alphaproteobacteria bacterium]